MKVRNGFVSNSSSSSFIVNFKKKVESAEDLKTTLNWEKFHETWDNLEESDFSFGYKDYYASVTDDDVVELLWHVICLYEEQMDFYNRNSERTIHTFDGLLDALFLADETGQRLPDEEAEEYGDYTYDMIVSMLHTRNRDFIKGFEADSEATGLSEATMDGKIPMEDSILFLELYYNGLLFDLFDGLPYVYQNNH